MTLNAMLLNNGL